MRPPSSSRATPAALAAVALACLPALAQEADLSANSTDAEFAAGSGSGSDNAVTGGVDFATGVNTGASGRLETRLAADLQSQTSTQLLSLGASGTLLGYAVTDDPQGEFGKLADPVARFTYRRSAFDGSFRLSGSVTEDDLAYQTATDPGIDLEDPFLDPTLLIDGTGLRRDKRLSFALTALEDLPVGVEVSGSFRDTDYIGTPENFVNPFTGDPGFLDTRTGEVDAALRLSVTPILTTRLGFGYSRSDTGQDFGTFQNRNAYLSAEYAATERLALDASIGLAETVRGQSGEPERGIEGGFGALYELPRGSVGFSYAHVFDVAGPRDEFSVSRGIDLPGGDALGLEIGLVRSEEGTDTVGAVDYVRTGRSDTLNLSLARTVRTSVSGELSTLTTLGAAYRYQLTARDGLTLGADYTEVGSVSSGRLTAGLDRQLTRDWGLSTGVERRIRTGAPDDDAVFFTLGRRFQLGD